MDPCKPRMLRRRRDPLPRQGTDGGRGPLGHRELVGRACVAEAIVVDVEALVETEPRVDRERTDERGRGIAALLQERARRALVSRQPIAAVVADAVLKGVR